MLQGSPNARQDATIKALDADGKTLSTYLLANAWPTKVEMSGTNAGPSVNVTLMCEQITVG